MDHKLPSHVITDVVFFLCPTFLAPTLLLCGIQTNNAGVLAKFNNIGRIQFEKVEGLFVW